MKIFNYEIKADKSSNRATITIDGIIGIGWTGSDDSKNTTEKINRMLKQIDDLGVEQILVKVNSPGGLVSHGLTIHDALKAHKASIEVEVYGMTASAATIIAMAADDGKVKMSNNAMLLIHKAWLGVVGNENDLESAKETLQTIDGILADIYAKKTGREKAEIIDLMNKNEGKGIWLDADSALSEKLIDSIFEPGNETAAAALFSNAKDLLSMGLDLPEGFDIEKFADIEKNPIPENTSEDKNEKSKEKSTLNNILLEDEAMNEIQMLKNMMAKAKEEGDEESVKIYSSMIEKMEAKDAELNSYKEKEASRIEDNFKSAVKDAEKTMIENAIPEDVRNEVLNTFEIKANEKATEMIKAFSKALSNVKKAVTENLELDLKNSKESKDPEMDENDWNK